MINENKIKAYALKNAIAYKGKANSGAVVSSLFAEGLEKSEIKDIMPKIQEVINEISNLSLDEQKKEFEKLEDVISKRKVREGLSELPDAENGVVMRFAPSPSGAMHVGHALTSSISYDYVKKYGGTFYVRVEDTNPENIYEPAYELLKKDADWLFEGKAKFVIQSDRMELYYKYAKKLIEFGNAYVCTCSGDDFREFSKKKKDCPCRSLTPKENLERWEEMLAEENGFDEGGAVLRFKSDMTHKNPAMRDFPLARINLTEHPRQGKKYRVWPLMNLSVATDDIEMKMTHVIRAKEHRDNAERQKMIFEVLGKKYPWATYLGRWHIKGLRLSASAITRDIKEGKYTGWGDSRLPTIQALMKKYKPEAFWKMAENRGLSEVDKIIDKEEFFLLLEKFNKT
ncbi:MAG: glutamate--tRNA ligase family protein [Candidatus Pacearchaeota archaeon]|nr:glutamate--tRNA ligase family protein [Candidatus Pacearchaeota archaeon]